MGLAASARQDTSEMPEQVFYSYFQSPRDIYRQNQVLARASFLNIFVQRANL
jgi:hypothetical protein